MAGRTARVALLGLALLGAWPAQAADTPPGGLPSLLGPLNCGRLSWLSGCETLNETMRENPSGPIRIKDPGGLEFSFAPGTPSVIIEHMLKPTPESAKRVLDWQDAQMARAKLSAQLVKEEMRRRGGERGGEIALFDARAAADNVTGPLDSRLSNDALRPVTFYYFYDSTCPTCQSMMSEVAKVLAAYPSMKVSMLQMNSDPAYLSKVAQTFRGDAIGLKGPQLQKYQAHVTSVPEIWVQNTRTKKTKVLKGYHRASDILQVLREATQ